MTAFLNSRWSRVVLLLGVWSLLTGAAVLAGERGRTFFFEAPLSIYPVWFLFMAWALGLTIASLFAPAERRPQTGLAGLAMVFFATIFREINTVSPWVLTQALMLCGVVTWLGFGKFSMKAGKGGGA